MNLQPASGFCAAFAIASQNQPRLFIQVTRAQQIHPRFSPPRRRCIYVSLVFRFCPSRKE
jgi:hypothetical protein